MSNQYRDLLHRASEALRRAGTASDRHGTVEKVEEASGERKALVIWGYKPDGSPCKVWSSSQEHRSGQQRSQDAVKPGQNVTLQGVDFRQATFTPQAEADHAPQPKHAPQINGPSQSIGKKLRTAYHGGEDDQQQQQQGSGQSGGGSGGQGGGQQQKYAKEHYSVVWIAKEDEKLKQWTPSTGAPTSKTGSQGSMDDTAAPQQEQQQEQQEERAMQAVMHEKEGHTLVIGKGDDAVRASAHPKGAKIRAGSENYVVAEKDKSTYIAAKENVFVSGSQHYVAGPWIIKKGPKDPVPNHDLA